jgi:hypothetical protein
MSDHFQSHSGFIPVFICLPSGRTSCQRHAIGCRRRLRLREHKTLLIGNVTNGDYMKHHQWQQHQQYQISATPAERSRLSRTIIVPPHCAAEASKLQLRANKRFAGTASVAPDTGWKESLHQNQYRHRVTSSRRSVSPGFVSSSGFERARSRLQNWWTQTIAALQRLGHELQERFEDARRRQPVDPTSAARPPLYPDGLYVLLGMWILTYLVVRLGQLVCDVLAFIIAIVVSVFYVPGQRIRRQQKTRDNTRSTMTAEEQASVSQAEESTNQNLIGGSGENRDRHRLRAIAARETTEAESAEWINAALRKMWRLYNTELSLAGKWILQDLIDTNLKNSRPPFVQSVTVERLELHERALRLPSVEKLPTRSDGDLVLLVGVRYDGDAQLHLRVNFGVTQRASFAVPVVVSGLDIDAQLWIRARMIPEAPYLGDVNVALLRRPLIDLQLRPFKVVDVMEVPGLRPFLRKLLTCDIPDLFVLPRRMPILRPSSLEQLQRFARMGAWDGSRLDPCMGALTKARFQRRAQAISSSKEETETGEIPFARETEAEAEILDDPSLDAGLLVVMLYGARNLSGTTSLGLSNPFCYLSVDGITVRSKPDKSTSARSVRGQPIWNQLFELPVRNPSTARLHIEVADRYGLKHRIIGSFSMALAVLKDGQRRDMWVPLRGSVGADSRLHIGVQYQAYVDADNDDLLMTESAANGPTTARKASTAALTRVFPLGQSRSTTTPSASAQHSDGTNHTGGEAPRSGSDAQPADPEIMPVRVEIVQPREER